MVLTRERVEEFLREVIEISSNRNIYKERPVNKAGKLICDIEIKKVEEVEISDEVRIY